MSSSYFSQIFRLKFEGFLYLSVLISFFCFSFSNSSASQGQMANPSFSCSKAKTKVELQICGNPEVSGLDLKLSEIYNEILIQLFAESVSEFRASQKGWLAQREECFKKENATKEILCLKVFYEKRIEELTSTRNELNLKAMPAKQAMKLIKDLSGVYCEKKTLGAYGNPEESEEAEALEELVIQTSKNPGIIRFKFHGTGTYVDDSCDLNGHALLTKDGSFKYLSFSPDWKCQIKLEITKKSITISQDQWFCGMNCANKGAVFFDFEFRRKNRIVTNRAKINWNQDDDTANCSQVLAK